MLQLKSSLRDSKTTLWTWTSLGWRSHLLLSPMMLQFSRDARCALSFRVTLLASLYYSSKCSSWLDDISNLSWNRWDRSHLSNFCEKKSALWVSGLLCLGWLLQCCHNHILGTHSEAWGSNSPWKTRRGGSWFSISLSILIHGTILTLPNQKVVATLALMAAEGRNGNFELGSHMTLIIVSYVIVMELADQQFWTLRANNCWFREIRNIYFDLLFTTKARCV